jgi:hypothetical protein
MRFPPAPMINEGQMKAVVEAFWRDVNTSNDESTKLRQTAAATNHFAESRVRYRQYLIHDSTYSTRRSFWGQWGDHHD